MKFGDLPTWLAAIGTICAFVVAFRQIADERAARKSADKQAAGQARRSQAECVSAWHEDNPEAPWDWLVLLNRSNEPVYRAVATLVMIQGTGPQTGEEWTKMDANRGEEVSKGMRVVLAVIPPGRYRVQVRGDWHASMMQAGAEIAFTDRGGRHWVRRALGELQEMSANAIEHYGVTGPIVFEPLAPTPYQ
jgi:hypothetical protein